MRSGKLRRLLHCVNFKTVGLGLRLRLASLMQGDDYLGAAVAQILRVRVPLTAVADHRYRLAVQKCEVRIAVVNKPLP